MRISGKHVAALTGAAALTAAVALWPSAVGADAGKVHGRALTWSYTEKRLEEQYVDNGAQGLSLGDMWVFTNTTDAAGGQPTSWVTCTANRLDATAATLLCHAAALTPAGPDEGQVFLQGTVRLLLGAPTGEGSFGVTGGTDAFAKARGDVHFTTKGSGLQQVITGNARVVVRP